MPPELVHLSAITPAAYFTGVVHLTQVIAATHSVKQAPIKAAAASFIQSLRVPATGIIQYHNTVICDHYNLSWRESVTLQWVRVGVRVSIYLSIYEEYAVDRFVFLYCFIY